ncbi:hypothetical protein J437_LFUL000959 [Ladona fulva]|uniref:Reverse transcriptase domain-containing protein n=1 Tax=Ladona fulva TaxID=123851 RepID=A0A8K0P3P3_LADFU|nr:hypothetical protein J437_LFUL000959 [Ladona fulva]
MSEATVPEKLKTAIVIPTHTGRSYKDTCNYRPISILPSLHKINKSISDNQFGFQKTKGTKIAIEKCAQTVNDALDNKSSVLLFVDLKKAFDTIDHKILLEKLFANGMRGTMH